MSSKNTEQLIKAIKADPSISLFIKAVLAGIILQNNKSVMFTAELRMHFDATEKVLKDKGIIEGT